MTDTHDTQEALDRSAPRPNTEYEIRGHKAKNVAALMAAVASVDLPPSVVPLPPIHHYMRPEQRTLPDGPTPKQCGFKKPRNPRRPRRKR